MKINEKSIIWIVACVSFGITSFVLFSYLTFPYQKLINVLISRMEARSPFQLRVNSAGPYLFPGLILKGVQITIRTEKEKESEGKKEAGAANPRRAGGGIRARIWDLSKVWTRAFSPWMRN